MYVELNMQMKPGQLKYQRTEALFRHLKCIAKGRCCKNIAKKIYTKELPLCIRVKRKLNKCLVCKRDNLIGHNVRHPGLLTVVMEY